MSTRPRKQIILAAYVGGVNEHTAWEHPDAGSQIAFDTFRQVAQTAERGRFDYFFLAEGLALRERAGRVFEHDIAGRPDTLPVLAALAAVTEHIGLVGTLNATFNEPYELARQLASLDHLSGGRAGWNVVTSWDAFTGQNFRRGGFLTREERYTRAEEFVNTVRELWDSWAEDAVLADKASGQFLADDSAGRFAHTGPQFDIDGRFTVPRSPQGRPVIVQAGISPQGRDFAAANSDLIFSPFSRLAEAQEFYVDVKARARAHGRNPDDLKIIPGAGFVLGDSRADAEEKARYILEQQLSDAAVQVQFEQLWNRDLSAYDIDGPLPDIEPDPDAPADHPGQGIHLPGSVRDRAPLACTGRGERSQHPRRRRRGVLSHRVHRHAAAGRRRAGRLHPERRRGRRGAGRPHHPGRHRRVRRQGRAPAAGARVAAHRVHRQHPAREPRPSDSGAPRRARGDGVGGLR